MGKNLYLSMYLRNMTKNPLIHTKINNYQNQMSCLINFFVKYRSFKYYFTKDCKLKYFYFDF